MFGWAQINQVCLVISGPFLVISDAPLGEFKMGFLLNTPHTLAVPSSCSNRLEYRPFAFMPLPRVLRRTVAWVVVV